MTKEHTMTTGQICLTLAVWFIGAFGLGAWIGPKLLACCMGQTMSREDALRLTERLNELIDARECCTDLPEDFDIEWIEEHAGDAA